MPRERRDKNFDKLTDQLLGLWVTQSEKKMVELAHKTFAPQKSLSEFLRSIVLRRTKQILVETRYDAKSLKKLKRIPKEIQNLIEDAPISELSSEIEDLKED